MTDFKLKDKNITIKFLEEENRTKENPLYLKNLLYDLPIDKNKIEEIDIEIKILDKVSTYIIDDINFEDIKSNKITFNLEEESSLCYRVFFANHNICKSCAKKESDTCQTIPKDFSKTLEINLNKKKSKAFIKCRYLGDDQGTFKINTYQNHLESETISKLSVKSVLDNKANIISNNEIYVEKNLKKVIAKQINKNLILSEESKALSKPSLKINSNNVECVHGATVYYIDKEETFYLQSKGINRYLSELILINAFLEADEE